MARTTTPVHRRRWRPLGVLGTLAVTAGLFALTPAAISPASAAIGDDNDELIPASALTTEEPNAAPACGLDLDGNGTPDGVTIKFATSGSDNDLDSEGNTGYELDFDDDSYSLPGPDARRIDIDSLTKNGRTVLFSYVIAYVGGNDRLQYNFSPPISTTDEDELLTRRPNGTYATGNLTQLKFCAYDPTPKIKVEKTANPTSVPETGGLVTYTVKVTNTGGTSVSLKGLNDDKFGDLDGVGTCDVPKTIAFGGSTSCTFTKTVTGTPGTTHTNIVTATAESGRTRVTATDDAAVAIIDIKPAMTVTKTANPTSVPETGGNVTFTFAVKNDAAEALSLTSLTDDVFGNLHGQGTCSVPQTVAIGGTYTCSLTKSLSGQPAAGHKNTMTAKGKDNENNLIEKTDDATVSFTDVKPNATVLKTANPTMVPETGGIVSFTAKVTNNGSEALSLIGMSDDVYGDLAAECDLPTPLAAGGSYTCIFQRMVSGSTGTPHLNEISAFVADDDGNQVTVKDDATVEFEKVIPEITVTKTANDDSVPETGQDVTYTVKVENTGKQAVNLTELTDDMFGDLNGAGTCALPVALAVGASTTCSFTELLSGAPGTTHTNVVTAKGIDKDGDTASDSDDAQVSFTDVLPAITVTKSTDVESVPETGGAVLFTVKVQNTTAEAVTLTTLSDDVFGNLAGKGTCATGGTIAGLGTYECSFTETLAGDAGGKAHVDIVTATVADDEKNTATDDDDATVIFTDVLPAITVEKAAGSATVPETGAPVTFTVKVTNTTAEPVTLTSLTDDVFGDLHGTGTCVTGGTIAGNGSYTCSFEKTIAGDASGPDHHNTVTALAADDEKNTASDEDDAVVDFSDVEPNITVVKTANPVSVPETGADVTFQFVVWNNTDEPVTLTALVDDVFGDLDGKGTCATGASIAPHLSYSCAITRWIGGDASGPDHHNVVTATGMDNEENTDVVTDDARVELADVKPAITVDKSDDDAVFPEPGGHVTYTVTVKNTTAEPVVITALADRIVNVALDLDITKDGDIVSDTTCGALVGTTLDGNGTATCEFTIPIFGNAGYVKLDRVTVTVTDNEKNVADASDEETTPIVDVKPAITVQKTDKGATLPEHGGLVTYWVKILNDSVEDVVVTNLFDIVDDDYSNWIDVTQVGDEVKATTCDTAVKLTLEPGEEHWCSFTLWLDRAAGDEVTDVVKVFAWDDEGNKAFGWADETTPVVDVKPTITVDKTDDGVSVTVGGSATYRVTVKNTSVEPVWITSVSDLLDGKVVDITTVGGAVSATSCNLLPGQMLQPGASSQCSFTVKLTAGAGSASTDTVTVSAKDDEYNAVSVSDTESTPVVAAPVAPKQATAEPEAQVLGIQVTAPTAPATPARAQLARTGGEATGRVQFGLALLAAGLVLVALDRRLRRRGLTGGAQA